MLVLAVGVLYLVKSKQDWGAFKASVQNLSPVTAFAGLGLFVLSQVLVALRWYSLLRIQKIDIGAWPAIKLTFVGLYYNNFLPSSVGGDAFRAWYVTHHTPKRLEAVFSVLFDRMVGFAGLILMAGAAFFFVPNREQMEKISFNTSFFKHLADQYGEIAVIVLAVLGLVVVGAVIYSETRRFLVRIAGVLVARGVELGLRVLAAVKIYVCRPFSMIWVMVLTFFCQFLFILGLWLVGSELGIKAPLVYYLIFFPISWVIGVLPVSIGGAVVVEGMLVFLFWSFAGVPQSQALALALAQRILILAGSLPGMFVHIAGKHAPTEFLVD